MSMRTQGAGDDEGPPEGGDDSARERSLREARNALGLLAMAAAVEPSTVADHMDLLLKARTTSCTLIHAVVTLENSSTAGPQESPAGTPCTARDAQHAGEKSCIAAAIAPP